MLSMDDSVIRGRGRGHAGKPLLPFMRQRSDSLTLDKSSLTDFVFCTTDEYGNPISDEYFWQTRKRYFY